MGLACESAAARQVARQVGLAAGTVRAIDQSYLERWAKSRKKPVLRQMGVDEIYLGKTQKFLTVVSNLETGEPLWFGPDRKQETLDELFRTELSAGSTSYAGRGWNHSSNWRRMCADPAPWHDPALRQLIQVAEPRALVVIGPQPVQARFEKIRLSSFAD